MSSGEGMATHSRTLAWKIPWMEEPGGLQSMGSLGVGHNWATSLYFFHFHALEKEMATHSSVLAWRIPGTGEPGGLPSMGSLRVGRDWSDLAAAAAAVVCLDFTFTFHFHALKKETATHSRILAWRIPGTGEPGGCRLWGRTESTRLKRLSSSSSMSRKQFKIERKAGVYFQSLITY